MKETPAPTSAPARSVYDDYPTDDTPMADNQPNADRMVDTVSALRHAYERRGTSAYIGYDIAVYPIEGNAKGRNAPDIFVAPGATPDERPSFLCWLEPDAPIVLAGEFLSVERGERLESPVVARRIAYYRERLQTPELFVYQPLGERFEDGFRFLFLRLGEDGEYHALEAGPDGWYPSVGTGLDLRPVNRRIEFRESGTGEEYVCAEVRVRSEAERAEAEAERAEAEAERAEAERRRADRLEEELRRLRGE